MFNSPRKHVVDSNGNITDSKKTVDHYLKPKKKNKGKGNAVRIGIENSSGDVIVIQDADLEYDFKDIGRLLEKIREGNRVRQKPLLDFLG